MTQKAADLIIAHNLYMFHKIILRPTFEANILAATLLSLWMYIARGLRSEIDLLGASKASRVAWSKAPTWKHGIKAPA